MVKGVAICTEGSLDMVNNWNMTNAFMLSINNVKKAFFEMILHCGAYYAVACSENSPRKREL